MNETTNNMKNDTDTPTKYQSAVNAMLEEKITELERERNEARRLAEHYRYAFTLANRMSHQTKLPWEKE